MQEKELIELLKSAPRDLLVSLILGSGSRFLASRSEDDFQSFKAIMAVCALAIITEGETTEQMVDEFESVKMAMDLLGKKP